MDLQPQHHGHADLPRLAAVHQHKEHERPHDSQQCPDNVDRPAAELVGQRTEQRHGQRIAGRAQHRRGQCQRTRQVQHAGDIGQRKHHHQRIEHVRADAHAAGHQQAPPVRDEHFLQRGLGLRIVRSHFPERRRLFDAAPQPQAEHHQRHARDERDAPAPGQEVLRAQEQRDQGNEASAQQRAGRRTHLRKGGIAPALVLPAVLHRQQHRAGPLATDRRALHKAQCHQQQRAPDAPRRIGRQQAHHAGGDAHQDQRGHQHKAAAELVAKMAEYHAAERPGHIADGVRGERQDGARKRIEGWKEDDVEDQRRHQVVDGKVIPLQRGPD
ncbi:hypothetical protein D9M72_239260 [compost metagenome]